MTKLVWLAGAFVLSGCVLPPPQGGSAGSVGAAQPSLVPPITTATGCRCAPGKTIVVSCRAQNPNQQPMTFQLAASSETGSFGVNANGTSPSLTLAAGQESVFEVNAVFSALMDCSSCKNSTCRVQ